jgi:2-keto-3-deoxy-L-rhamnonate aldolase RhmA
MRDRFGEGSAAFGITLTIPDPFLAEVIAAAPFDFLLVDTEHSPVSMYALQTQLIALRLATATVLVRIAHNDPTTIMQVLDLGAGGVVVPHVETADECAQMLRAAFYPPRGDRGIGPRRAQRLGDRAHYLHTANDDIVVLAMLESSRAIDNVDAILDVEDLGGVIVGAADLAASLGHLGDPTHNDVVGAIDHIFDKCAARGVPFGMYAASPEVAGQLVCSGAQVITVGSDLMLLEQGLGRVVQAMAPVPRRKPASC